MKRLEAGERCALRITRWLPPGSTRSVAKRCSYWLRNYSKSTSAIFEGLLTREPLEESLSARQPTPPPPPSPLMPPRARGPQTATCCAAAPAVSSRSRQGAHFASHVQSPTRRGPEVAREVDDAMRVARLGCDVELHLHGVVRGVAQRLRRGWREGVARHLLGAGLGVAGRGASVCGERVLQCVRGGIRRRLRCDECFLFAELGQIYVFEMVIRTPRGTLNPRWRATWPLGRATHTPVESQISGGED